MTHNNYNGASAPLENLMSGATANDFNKWEDHAKSVDLDALKYIVGDCASARDAMKGWNPEKENYYQDMCLTYSHEIYMRLKK